MEIYTFITEYKEKTYINQYLAKSLDNALSLWGNNLDCKIFSISKRKRILSEINDEVPCLLKGLKNAWCVCFLSGKSFILQNIVKTAQKVIDKDMKTYTVIIQYLGGTYISQHLVSMPQDAFLTAINENIEDQELKDFNKDMLKEMQCCLEKSGLVALTGLQNVWYFSFAYNQELCHSHIIETVIQ